MGRAIALLLVSSVIGCTDGDVPPLLPLDAGVELDFSGGGGPCATACDCPTGLACRNQVCEQAGAPVFCCDNAATCSGSSVCQFHDGTVSQCDRADGGGVPPVVDGGTAAACLTTSCTRGVGGNAFCKLACGNLTATCVKTGGIEHCMP